MKVFHENWWNMKYLHIEKVDDLIWKGFKYYFLFIHYTTLHTSNTDMHECRNCLVFFLFVSWFVFECLCTIRNPTKYVLILMCSIYKQFSAQKRIKSARKKRARHGHKIYVCGSEKLFMQFFISARVFHSFYISALFCFCLWKKNRKYVCGMSGFSGKYACHAIFFIYTYHDLQIWKMLEVDYRNFQWKRGMRSLLEKIWCIWCLHFGP